MRRTLFRVTAIGDGRSGRGGTRRLGVWRAWPRLRPADGRADVRAGEASGPAAWESASAARSGGPGVRGFGGTAVPAGPGGPGGGGVLISDVLTPAAAFLGISVSTLASDLNGGKTLAQEATAKGKTAADLINAIVAAQKTNLDNQKAAGWITADQETALLRATRTRSPSS